MSAGFTVSGLVSGIDTNSLVSQLIQVERIPVTSMQRQQAEQQRSISAFESIKTRLSALTDAAKKIDSVSDFSSFVTASSSSTAVSAVASGSANVGALSFTVTQLASQHQLFGDDSFTSGSGLVGAGTVTITVGGTAHDITTNDATTLDDLAATIADLDIGVNASVIDKGSGDYRLMLTSSDTGADAAFTVSSTAAGISSFTEVATAGNAIVTFGSGASAVTVERSTNTVSDLIPGVTLTLSETTVDPVTVTTSRNDDAAVEAIQDFVTELNSAINEMASAIKYDPDTGGGPLSGNSTVRDMLESLRRIVSQPVDNLSGSYTYASSVGLSIQSNGTFVLNEATLRTALANDFDAVTDLFAASASATDTRVSFSNASSSTLTGTYNVQITQAAQVASVTGGAFVDPGADPAFFTITAFGQDVSVATTPHSTAQEVVDAINAALSSAGISQLSASVDGGAISLATTTYGAAAEFTVDVDGDAYGINGTYNGVDVAGTINGQLATGTGRLLRSTAGDSNGLRLNITASQSEVVAAGGTLDLGNVDYSSGIGGGLVKLLNEFTEPDGRIARATDSIQDRIDLYQDRIDAFERRMVLREEYLRRQFTAMEQAVSQLQSQANFFASQLGALSGGQ